MQLNYWCGSKTYEELTRTSFIFYFTSFFFILFIYLYIYVPIFSTVKFEWQRSDSFCFSLVDRVQSRRKEKRIAVKKPRPLYITFYIYSFFFFFFLFPHSIFRSILEMVSILFAVIARTG